MLNAIVVIVRESGPVLAIVEGVNSEIAAIDQNGEFTDDDDELIEQINNAIAVLKE